MSTIISDVRCGANANVSDWRAKRISRTGIVIGGVAGHVRWASALLVRISHQVWRTLAFVRSDPVDAERAFSTSVRRFAFVKVFASLLRIAREARRAVASEAAR
jgi:hypothetical protein